MKTKTVAVRRLNAVKKVNVEYATRCECCGKFFHHEKMWVALRKGANNTKHNWFYCQGCAKTEEEVIQHVSTDNCTFGLAEN